jgi:hypothetical protein
VNSGDDADPHRNAPDPFTDEQRYQLDKARDAWSTVKRTLEHLVEIGKGLLILRLEADAVPGKRDVKDAAFKRLKEQQGLGDIDDSSASRMRKIAQHESEVRKWHESLTDEQRIKWASPNSICQQCPALKKKPSESPADGSRASKRSARPTKSAQLDQAKTEIEYLKEHVQELEAARESPPEIDALWRRPPEEIAAEARASMDPDKFKKFIAILTAEKQRSKKKAPTEAGA